jgi:hypothetical protein
LNLYFLVEGRRTEKAVYEAWVGHCFPGLRRIERPEDLDEDCFRLVAANGYPDYLERIRDVLEESREIAKNRIDHLFVCVDAEEESFEDRLAEVEGVIRAEHPIVPWTVVVQNCCIETWFLGNRSYVKANPSIDPDLEQFMSRYDVRTRDPEELPNLWPDRFATRAAFHEAYLKAVHRERHEPYRKSKPRVVSEKSYLLQLSKRSNETAHLPSFGRLAATWRELGAPEL